ncbi:hypothetical protein FACS18942_02460 [Planctomycetales bacterium]|nr:hypothetical protein FACS18942_02460 [Planctomycetales bacterium]GHT36678.1 hypothetical protein FACS189427_08730 [Planctomycetales bacterium]
MVNELPHFSGALPAELSPAVSELDQLNGFLRLIDNLPEEYRQDFYKQFLLLLDSFEHRQQILSYVQETLSMMKADLKYMVFDLEATRRERDEYKERLMVQ